MEELKKQLKSVSSGDELKAFLESFFEKVYEDLSDLKAQVAALQDQKDSDWLEDYYGQE